MENFFFPLKSVTDTWLSSSTTPWVMDVILGILCGLGLFLLLCAFFPSNPPGPLPQRKTNARKVELRGKKKSRKKDNVLKRASLLASEHSAEAGDPPGKGQSEAQSTLPFWVTRGSGTSLRAKVATLLEEPPRKAPGQEGLTKAVPTLQTPLSAPSPAFKKGQGTPSQIPASSTAQWARWSSQPLTGSLKGRTEQRVITGIGRSGQEPHPHPAPARNGPQEQRGSEASPDPCHLRKSLYRSTGSQSLSTGDTMGIVKPKEKGPTCKIVVGAHTLANSQTISVSLSSARSPGRSQSRSPAAQKVDVPGPITQDVGDLDIKVEIQAEHRAQSPACGILLQDLTTGIISEGRTAGMSITDYHRDVVSRASRATPAGSQSLSSTKVSAAQESRAFTRTAGSSQGQHVPRSRIVQSPWKNQTQMPGPDTTGGYKRPRSGGQEQRLGGPACSQTSGMSHSVQSRGIRNVFGSKDPELLEEKRQAPTENYFRKTMTKLAEYFNPIKKSKEQEEPLQEGKPPTVTAQHRGPVMGKVFSDSRGADAQALSEIVAEIMLNELKLQHAEGPSKFNCHKDYFQPAVGRRSGNHSGPSYPEQRRLMKDVASVHQATSRGHSFTKNRWIQDKDSKWIPSAWESVPQANPKQHRPRGARSTDCPVYSPGHYLLQRDVPSGPSGPPPHSFPAGENL
ncbi:hypothetical protein TREES_T100000027 [Tupaia chinensis]|uniref:Uncharacterized protein n=1 Tax=Tupaia chinensis TaxID=246437 RepID=L9LE17_TUPCH|nr:hypothetical protein TREES_T100000027 [Tupaia chinensis]